jgi:isoleucyl-tRNA synthetase
MGADIIRLWVAATDYSGEMTIGDEILKRVADGYRRIRNTLRFLLANTSDFDAATQSVPVADMLEIDRYALALTAQFQADALAQYERFEFHPVVAKLQTFCSEDLGSFYVDVLKDRLYTTAAASPARRSAQNALYHIVHALLRWMAPVLSFTAAEAWRVFQTDAETVFAQTAYRFPEVPDGEALIAKWTAVREFRSEVQKVLEKHREAGEIGSPLQAEVDITADGEKLALLKALGDELRFVLITSRADVASGPDSIRVAPSKHLKCARCWHWRADVGADAKHPEICGRCVSNLFGPGEPRRFS